MFKKAKQKIVFSILAILGAVLLGTLGMIYISSYISTTAQNYKVLEQQMENMLRDPKAGQPDQNADALDDMQPRPFDDIRGPKRIQRNLEIGTFYCIKILSDGTSEVIENGANGLYTNDELTEFAKEVSSKTKGKKDNLLYLVSEKDGTIFVCFMDNSMFSENFTRLFLFTLLFGAIAMIPITFISIYIANRIISPMEESYEKQKQFTADAGHELKTPVSVVATNLELLRREVGDNKWLDNISYENERMRHLIIQLLELARNENQEIERNNVDISHIVEGAILPYEAIAFEKNILIEEDIAKNVTAKVNEKSIEQFTAILLDNAISHSKCEKGEFGKVTIKLIQSKGAAILSVSNPGDEIPEAERKKLFERFYRTDSSHEFTGHYGLGLAIAKSIADANNAKIEVLCKDGIVTFQARFLNQ